MWFWKNKTENTPLVEQPVEQSNLPTPPKGKVTENLFAHITAQNEQLVGSVTEDGNEESRLKMTLRSATLFSEPIADWFSAQSFIGYPLCAVLAQQWLINKACIIPARDATRNGYDIVSMNGDDIPDATVKTLQAYDKRFKIRKHCEEFVGLGRVFGIRIAIFDIESTDPEFYEKPFNLDGVEQGAYKGISQVDPMWCMPEFVQGELNNPASRYFYEPTYWRIGGQRYHRSHLHIFRNGYVPDILKPVYMFGGYPVPQQIMNRVYTAERSTDESLGLVTSKRTTFWQTNMAAFMADEAAATEKLQRWIALRDNYGVKVGDKDDDQLTLFDTTLSGLDDVIMTNYQVVAAAANVPAVKLLGTSPKGFSSGEEESKNYFQELESIQEHDLTDFIERHHQLVMKSCGLEVLDLTVSWRPVDSPTARELAERNQMKAGSYSQLVMAGAVSAEEVRDALAKDPDSGFHELGNAQQGIFDESTMQALNELGINLDEKA